MTKSTCRSIGLWVLIVGLFTIFMSVSVLAGTLSRSMPSQTPPGSTFTVSLSIPDAVSGEVLTVEETLPSGVTLSSWDISGAKESKTDIQKDPKKYRVKANSYGWSVTPNGPIVITYTATAPSSEGTLNFEAVWFDKSGFNKNQATLAVTPTPPSTPPPAPQVAPAPAPTAQPQPPATPTPSPISPKPKSTQPPKPSSGGWIWSVILIAILAVTVWWYSKKN